MAQQKIHASTQKFTEVEDIVDTVVIFKNGTAASVIEVRATNFSLLSRQEQDAKIYAYAALLNSLSFPVQILIRSKKVDISQYIKQLEAEISKTQNDMLATHILLYKDFIEELVRVNTVLDKRFYVVVSYSYLEKGAAGVAAQATKSGKAKTFAEEAKAALTTKTNALHSQLTALALPAKTLEKEELIKLFYGIYNEGISENTDISDAKAPMIQGTMEA